MRTIISVVVAVVVAAAIFIFVGYIAISEGIVWSDYWTGLAIVLTATALGVLYWGTKPYIDKYLRKETQEIKTVTMTSTLGETHPSTILQGSLDITKLNIDNDLLDEIHKQARLKAIEIYHDARFSIFTVQVFPFANNLVNVYMGFYSKWADKICELAYNSSRQEISHPLPDKHPYLDEETEEFANPPWKKSPQWKQFIERAYAKIGPLNPARQTAYHLFVYANMQWALKFEDGFSGNEYWFDWNGKGLDEGSIRQRAREMRF